MGSKNKTKTKTLESFLLLVRQNWVVGVIFLLVTVFGSPYFFKGVIPFPSDYLVNNFAPWQYYYSSPVKNAAMPDVVTQMFPWKHLVLWFLRSGQIPLWNPYNFSGSPLLANYQSSALHPANVLFLFLSEINAWSLMILLQPLLAGFFTYIFSRSLKISRGGSLISAMAFMFCGFMVTWMAYGTLSWALLWLPLVLWGIETSFNKRSIKSLVIISVSISASFFCGHFQTSLYVTIVAFLYLFYKLFSVKNYRAFWYCAIFLVLGLLMTSVQLLPTFELYQYSVRSKTIGTNEIIPWRYLITMIAPDFFGNPVTRNDWYGHYAEWCGFTGVIPLILAIYAVLQRKKGKILFFSLLGLFALILTRQTPLLDIIVALRIPVLSSSAASRIIGLTSFSIAILSGFGFDLFCKKMQENNLRKINNTLIFSLLILLAIVASILIFKWLPADKITIALRNIILPVLIIGAYSLLNTIYRIMYRRVSKNLIRKLQMIIALILLLLTATDLLRFAKKWMPFASRDLVYPNLPVVNYLAQTASYDRAFGFFGMELQNYFRIAGFGGYDPLFSQRYGQLLLAANDGQIQEPSTRGVSLEKRGKYTINLLNLMGGKYIIHAIADDHLSWVFPFWEHPERYKNTYADEKYEVYINEQASPRAFVVYDYQVETNPQEIVNKMFDQGVDLSKVVILEKNPGIQKNLKISDKGEVNLLQYTSNKISYDVLAEQAGLFFLSDNFFPGWKAYVNNQETEILRADYTFRAIVVPEGKSNLVLEYRPIYFKIGLGITIASLFAMLISAVYIYIGIKNENSTI